MTKITDAPNLSIIVPCHNSESTIVESLSAIRNSTFDNYELIVIDDASTDNSLRLAKSYADKTITVPKVKTFFSLRIAGFNQAKNNIIINIDSDIVIKPEALQLISEYFCKNPNVDAITGILSITTPSNDFYSRYKNIYMNYGFSKLPKEVTFLYGSIYAIRNKVWKDILESERLDRNLAFCDDIELGQLLTKQKKSIHLLKELEVVHLKKYTFRSLLKNDFLVSKSFAQIVSLGKVRPKISLKTPVFAHASLTKVVSIMLVYMVLLSLVVYHPITSTLIVIWALLNTSYFNFIYQCSNTLFTICSIVFTFLDHFILGAGIIFGFIFQKNKLIDSPRVLKVTSKPAASINTE